MIVREMTLNDVTAVGKIHVDTWRVAYKGIVPQDYLDGLNYTKSATRWENGILERPEVLRYVAEIGGEIAGFIAGLNNRSESDLPHIDSELWAIYVHPNHFRDGVGQALVQELTNKLRDLKKKKMCVWVLADNHRAINFYKKCGGVKTSAEKMIEIGGANLLEISYEITF